MRTNKPSIGLVALETALRILREYWNFKFLHLHSRMESIPCSIGASSLTHRSNDIPQAWTRQIKEPCHLLFGLVTWMQQSLAYVLLACHRNYDLKVPTTLLRISGLKCSDCWDMKCFHVISAIIILLHNSSTTFLGCWLGECKFPYKPSQISLH